MPVSMIPILMPAPALPTPPTALQAADAFTRLTAAFRSRVTGEAVPAVVPIGNDPPQLTADIESAAKGENVQIAETNERPVAPAPGSRRYLQHDLDIKLREVDLQSLTRFLRRVETGPHFVFFTRISLKHRYSENDKLDAELTATAFEKMKDDKKKKPEGAKPAGTKE